MASGVALLKCRRALVKFRFHPPNGRVTCGAVCTGKDTRGRPIDPNRVFEYADALLAADLYYGNSFQHDVPIGLGASSVMWNLVSDRTDVHVLTGTILSDLYIDYLGTHSASLGVDRSDAPLLGLRDARISGMEDKKFPVPRETHRR